MTTLNPNLKDFFIKLYKQGGAAAQAAKQAAARNPGTSFLVALAGLATYVSISWYADSATHKKTDGDDPQPRNWAAGVAERAVDNGRVGRAQDGVGGLGRTAAQRKALGAADGGGHRGGDRLGLDRGCFAVARVLVGRFDDDVAAAGQYSGGIDIGRDRVVDMIVRDR